MATFTHTYAVLELSSVAYEEIRSKLQAAGYEDQFLKDDVHGDVIDMHGIAIAHEKRGACPRCKSDAGGDGACANCGLAEEERKKMEAQHCPGCSDPSFYASEGCPGLGGEDA